MKTTPYYLEDVLLRRPYIQQEWCEQALNNPLMKIVQPDGRIRHWTFIEEKQKYLRVVTLDGGETIHNAFFDRGFKKQMRNQ